METKVKIVYKHPIKEDVNLEVVGVIYNTDDTTTYIKRIDGYSIDIPTANIISTDAVPKQ